MWYRPQLCLMAALLLSRGTTQAETCRDADDPPSPTEIAVTAVPIVVTSTTDDYFVLYVTHDVDGTELELPVLVKRGEAGTTTLSENVAALAAERYRVEKYPVATPADVDGDCTDDITELDNLGSMNPVNPAGDIARNDGAVTLPDRETLESVSGAFQTPFFSTAVYVKFLLVDIDADRPGVYFMNTGTHPSHQSFLDVVGFERSDVIAGGLAYAPNLVARDGSSGV